MTHEKRIMMNKISYDLVIRPIMYAMLCTRLDVSHTLSVTSRYQVILREGHWTVVKNILKYLKSTKDVILVYGGAKLLCRC